jgi:hypothetical protein
MPLRAHIAALVLALFCGPALAADIIGYGEAFDTLYRIDLSTHTAQELGAAGFLNGQQRIANIEGLTFSPDGQLYAVSDSLKVLLQINGITGAATLVGPLNLAGQSITQQLDLGLTFTCDGGLWLSAGNGKFWRVDPATGATTLVGDFGVTITGLASRGNDIYGAGSQGDNNLYMINPTTAQATAIGSYGVGAYITTASPGFDAAGQLQAILDYVPPEPGITTVPMWSDLAVLDASSGSLNNTGVITGPADLQFIGLKGLAIAAPVCAATRPGDPTPTLSVPALGVLIALMMLVAGTRLRQRRRIS